jgi:hypothetical protein
MKGRVGVAFGPGPPEGSVSHQKVTRAELRAWIVQEVRRTLKQPAFDVDLAFLSLPGPDRSGATWWLHTVGEDMLTWSEAYLDAFDAAVRQAQETFDLSD